MKKIWWLWIVGGGIVLGWIIATDCTAETPTEHNLAILKQDSLMLENAFASMQPHVSCTFRWTFPKGVDPVRSKEFIFKHNRDGTITAWAACNPTFKRKS